MEAQGEQLLQDLITHEQKLVAKVEDARREAAEIVNRAEAEAERIDLEAKQKADQLQNEQTQRTKEEADAIRREVLAAAEQEVADIEEAAKKHQDKAVKLVLERVMP